MQNIIIIKFKEDKKANKNGHYYIYERKSFRVDGKVKKKDKYLLSISHFSWEKEDYFIKYYKYWDFNLNPLYKKVPIYFPEELKDDFYKAVNRYKARHCGG